MESLFTIFNTNVQNLKESNFDTEFESKKLNNGQLLELAKLEANNRNIKNAYKCLEQIIKNDQASSCMALFIFLRIKKSQNLLTEDNVDLIINYLISCDQISDIIETHACVKILNKSIFTFPHNKMKTIKLVEYNKQAQKIMLTELPTNFSWVNETLAGSGIVKQRHIPILKSLGFTKIITLIESNHPKEFIDACKEVGIDVVHFSTIDRHPTTFENLNQILQIIRDGKVTLVHCLGGCGRAAHILAAYLIKTLKISPSEAITMLDKQRKIILTNSQNVFIKKFYGLCNAPKNAMKLKKVSLPGLIMLIGPPCSGKTTFSLELITNYDEILHLCQDELGRQECSNLFSSKAKSRNIILDRCAVTKRERKEWLDSYKQLTDAKIWAVYFDVGVELCKQRVGERTNHPTLGGAGAIKIIEDIYGKLEEPVLSEGFDEIIRITNNDTIVLAKNKFGYGFTVSCDSVMKFPRTRHLANMGSMTKDDLLFNQQELNEFLSMELTIEEKIDGANLGIFYDYESCKIMAQNRSHFVCSSYHPQFKLLDKWIHNHMTELLQIFDVGNYLIFGEWVYFKHSIKYTKLPDYFVAYDIYDRTNEVFLSRTEVLRLLEPTSIKVIRTIYTGRATLDKLKTLVNTDSIYYDGPVEGVYVRGFVDGKVKFRGKIVRSDFICGDVDGNVNHWTKGIYTQNQLVNAYNNEEQLTTYS